MRRGLLIALCGAALAVTAAEPTPIPGTRVSLEVPARFTLAQGFPGIVWREAGASVVIGELPAPSAKMQAQMTREQLATRGMALLDSRPVHGAIGPSRLLHVSQNARGAEFRKWILIAGDERSTVMITATVPAVLAAELGDTLRATLLSARWDPGAALDPLAGAGFGVTESADLKIARGIGAGALILTRGGASGKLGASDPLLTVSKSTASVAISDLATFSKRRLAQTRTVHGPRVRSENALQIAGMPAHELTASAADSDGRPVTVYQALAYDGSDYYVVQGFVRPADEARFLPQFAEVARSLQPR